MHRMSTAASISNSMLFRTSSSSTGYVADHEDGCRLLLGGNGRHCLTGRRVHVNGAPICNRVRPRTSFVRGVKLRVGLYFLHEDSSANGDEVTAIILGDGMVVHLQLQGARFIVCTPT